MSESKRKTGRFSRDLKDLCEFGVVSKRPTAVVWWHLKKKNPQQIFVFCPNPDVYYIFQCVVHSWERQPCVTMRRFRDPRMKGSWVNDCLEEIVCRLKGSISREEQLKVLAAVSGIGTNETWLGSYSTEDVLAVNVFPSIHRYLGASVQLEFELWRVRTIFFPTRKTNPRAV